MFPRLFRIILLAAIFNPVGWLPAAGAADEWIRVRWVDDGDTIVLADGRRVRYIGIDAPEIAHDRHGQKAEPFGYEALGLNRHLVHRKRVRLELDEETHDAYGRLLAYVFLAGERMVNEEMLVNGYAYVLPHWPNRHYAQQLLNAQRTAMRDERGIWRQWKQSQGSVVGNRRSRRFHAPSCPNIDRISVRNRVSFATPWEAFWQGYAPAKGCIKK